MPAHLASASSLLLFNSTQNPYKKYSALDTMVGAAEEAQEDEDEGPTHAAPKSVMTGETYEGMAYQAQFNLACRRMPSERPFLTCIHIAPEMEAQLISKETVAHMVACLGLAAGRQQLRRWTLLT